MELPVEKYTRTRKAELLLANAVDADDYARAVAAVKAMGLAPAKIKHKKPKNMSLQNQRELEASREKLRLLEARYEASKRDESGDRHVRELSMRSLKRLINQLKEEIARFESRSSLGAPSK